MFGLLSDFLILQFILQSLQNINFYISSFLLKKKISFYISTYIFILKNIKTDNLFFKRKNKYVYQVYFDIFA